MTEFKEYMIEHPGLITPISRMVVKLKNRGTIISGLELRSAALSADCLVAFNNKECIANYDARCLKKPVGDIIPFCRVINEEIPTIEISSPEVDKNINGNYTWLSWFF